MDLNVQLKNQLKHYILLYGIRTKINSRNQIPDTIRTMMFSSFESENKRKKNSKLNPTLSRFNMK